jgi:dimethylargininase
MKFVYRNAITRLPSSKIQEGITTQNEMVDLTKAIDQHDAYVKQLKQLDLHVTQLDQNHEYPDSHFVEDTAFVYQNSAFLTQPGAYERRGEVALIRPALAKHFEIFEITDENAFIDGGDILLLGNHILIGLGGRTNLLGAQHFKQLINHIYPDLTVTLIPFSGVLHLKSGLTALNDTTLLGNPACLLDAPIDFAKIHWLPSAYGYAANTLTVNEHTFYFQEAHCLESIILAENLTPVPMALSEFRKMDGSFTCLSLLW